MAQGATRSSAQPHLASLGQEALTSRAAAPFARVAPHVHTAADSRARRPPPQSSSLLNRSSSVSPVSRGDRTPRSQVFRYPYPPWP
eukprot:7390185-Prymnesium_polylepis.1